MAVAACGSIARDLDARDLDAAPGRRQFI